MSMKFTKAHILSEIKRVAVADGSAPGRRRFESETGIKENDWYGKHWRTWGDALIEAGYSPNDKQGAYDDDWLLEQLVAFIRQLGRFPVTVDFRMNTKTEALPDQKTFRKRLGSKGEQASKVIEWCSRQDGFQDVVNICKGIAETVALAEPTEVEAPNASGYVYMFKSGKRYKIGYTESLEKRYAGLSAQVSHELIQVHAILTDDPSGIEAYWHNRFKAKRRHNEWFELTAEDVAAFKKRKFM